MYVLQYVQKMHGMNNLKFVNAKQARNTYEYSNIKRRLHKTIAGIWFNKTCREKEWTVAAVRNIIAIRTEDAQYEQPKIRRLRVFKINP